MTSPSPFFRMLKLKLPASRDTNLAAIKLRQDFRAEADHDLAKHSVIGMFSYFVIWLIIYYASELKNIALLEFLAFLLAAVAVWRLYLALNFNILYAANILRWRRLFSIGTILSGAVWGSVCALTLNYDGLGATSVMVMLSTAGIASGGIISLAPAARLGGIFLALLLLPTIVFALLSGAIPERGIALLFLTFFIFMFILWRELHVKYWRVLAGRAKLRRAKEAAEAASLAKGEFIANVSHELRTPLTAIIGALGMIENYPPDGMSAQTMTLVDIAYKNSQRLSILINDILDFEKLNANPMKFHCQSVALTPFLMNAIELNHSYAESYSVSFILEQPLTEVEVIADENRLMQVMTNLLSNAAKHSPAGEQVLIRVVKSEGKARIAVSDHGAGIPKTFRKHVFDRFTQAESSTTRKKNGTGLGLAISKSIIEQMGGVIGFDSDIGRGTTFYFDLPLSKNHQPSPEIPHT